MGKGKIVKALTEGQFTMDYLYNVEFIEFEIARMQLRKAEIEDTALPAAEADLATKEDELTARSEEMDTLLKELNGDVSPAVIAKLQTAVNALANAESTLNAIGTKLATATSNLNSSVAAFPEPAPVEVATAYNDAFNALTTATLERGDEENALNTAQGYANTALSLAQASTPDPEAVRDAIQQSRDAMTFLLSESGITASAIATASSAVSSAEGSLPGDTSWDLARDYAAAAVFQMSNSDPELLGGIGAQPLHGQVGAYYTQASAALLEAADMMVPGKGETGKAIIDKLKEVHAAKSAADLAAMTIDQLNLELSNIEKRLDEFEAIPKEKRNSFWCADYTTELDEEREVGTCEIPGEYEGKAKGEVVIRPGFDDATLDWNQPRDGFMTPVQALTPAGCFYNLAMLPGWQVYRPQFRFATLTKINDDQTVNLEIIEPNKSSQPYDTEQRIDVTPRPIPEEFHEEEPATKILENVEVSYMDCGVAAFFEQDEVLIEYTNREAAKPKVIGFRKNPRPCAPVNFYTPRELLTIPATAWKRTVQEGQLYGNAYWVGRTGALSWNGLSGRHFAHLEDPAPGPYIYQDGKVIGTAPGKVRGACIQSHDNAEGVNVKWLIAVCREHDLYISGDQVEYFYIIPLDDVTVDWTLLHSQTYGPGMAPDSVDVAAHHFESVWFFNDTGTEGVCVKRDLDGARPAEWQDTRTRMVQFQVMFNEEGVPVGTFVWTPVRKWALTESNTFSDTCTGGIASINCIKHNTFTAHVRRYDVYADYVGTTLMTFDEINFGGAVNHMECGPLAECPSDVDINAATVDILQTTDSTTHLVCDALGFDVLTQYYTTSFTQDWTQVQTEVQEEPQACASTVTINTEDVDQFSGLYPEWLDFQGGAGKVQYLYRDAMNSIVTTTHEERAYHIGGGVDITNSDFASSGHTSTAILDSGGATQIVGTKSESLWTGIFDPGIREALWACADRKGHCIVSSEQFDTKVGNPALPYEPPAASGVFPTFEAVGLG